MQEIEQLIREAAELRQRLTTNDIVDRVISKMRANMHEFALIDPNPFSHIPTGKGLYLFETKFPFSTMAELNAFGEAWGVAKGAKIVNNCPRFYSRRAWNNLGKITVGEFLPLYLGKQEDINARVNLHLTDVLTSTTYGLKLKARASLFDGCKFRVGGVILDIPSNGYFCVELIEAAVREKLHPLLGKQ